MTSEKLTATYSTKLDEIIQFFVRERESQIHQVTFEKDNRRYNYNIFLMTIVILFTVPNIMLQIGAKENNTAYFIFGLIILMGITFWFDARNNNKKDDYYKIITHKFDVIIGCLQTSNISGKQIETSKLIKLMEERPKKIVDKIYEAWLDKAFGYIKRVSEENTHQETYIGNSG